MSEVILLCPDKRDGSCLVEGCDGVLSNPRPSGEMDDNCNQLYTGTCTFGGRYRPFHGLKPEAEDSDMYWKRSGYGLVKVYEKQMTWMQPDECEIKMNVVGGLPRAALPTAWQMPVDDGKVKPDRQFVEEIIARTLEIVNDKANVGELIKSPTTVMYPFYMSLLGFIRGLWLAADAYKRDMAGGAAVLNSYILEWRLLRAIKMLMVRAPREYFKVWSYHGEIMRILHGELNRGLDEICSSLHDDEIEQIVAPVEDFKIAFNKFFGSLIATQKCEERVYLQHVKDVADEIYKSGKAVYLVLKTKDTKIERRVERYLGVLGDPMTDEDAANEFMRKFTEQLCKDKSLRYKGKPLVGQKDALRYMELKDRKSPYFKEIRLFYEVADAHHWKAFSSIYQHCKNLGKESGTNAGSKKKTASKEKKKLIDRDSVWPDAGVPLMGLEHMIK